MFSAKIHSFSRLVDEGVQIIFSSSANVHSFYLQMWLQTVSTHVPGEWLENLIFKFLNNSVSNEVLWNHVYSFIRRIIYMHRFILCILNMLSFFPCMLYMYYFTICTVPARLLVACHFSVWYLKTLIFHLSDGFECCSWWEIIASSSLYIKNMGWNSLAALFCRCRRSKIPTF